MGVEIDMEVVVVADTVVVAVEVGIMMTAETVEVVAVTVVVDMEVVVDLVEEAMEVVVETTTQEVEDTDHERTLPIKVCRKMKMEDADEKEAVMPDVYIVHRSTVPLIST